MPLLTLSVGRAVDSIVIFIFCTFVRVFIAGIFLFKIIFLRIILIRIVGFIKFAVIKIILIIDWIFFICNFKSSSKISSNSFSDS